MVVRLWGSRDPANPVLGWTRLFAPQVSCNLGVTRDGAGGCGNECMANTTQPRAMLAVASPAARWHDDGKVAGGSIDDSLVDLSLSVVCSRLASCCVTLAGCQ